MEKLDIAGVAAEFYQISFGQGTLLLAKCPKGVLGCGYLDLAVADRLGDAVAQVTGVKTFEDLLNAEVKGCSQAASKLGIKLGMTGYEAVKLLN